MRTLIGRASRTKASDAAQEEEEEEEALRCSLIPGGLNAGGDLTYVIFQPSWKKCSTGFESN